MEKSLKSLNKELALKDVYLVLTDPQAAARLMEMNLLDPKKEEKEFQNKVGSIANKVDSKIAETGERVPNQSSMEENKNQVIKNYGCLRSQVEGGLREMEKESNKAEGKAKELEKEKEKREQKILENHYAVPGRRLEPDYMKEQLNRIDKNWHIREQYSSPESDPISPPEVNEEALRWWNRWLNK